MTKDELIRLWADDQNWRGWWGYFCKADPRVVVPKRTPWGGWTVNFAHPMAVPVIGLAVVIAVGPTLLLLALGVRDPSWLFAALVCSIVLLIGSSYYLSGATHPEALPQIILLVAVITFFAWWACQHKQPLLALLAPAAILLYWMLNRGR